VGENLNDVIVYGTPGDQYNKNRGFCFVDYDDHKSASDAKRRIEQGKVTLFNMQRLAVDWAEQQTEPDEDVMATASRHTCTLKNNCLRAGKSCLREQPA
jgi:hypothetical protein